MEMMRAVLDTNLWLATHVVIITIGYSATFLAFLAIIYVVRGVFTPSLGRDRCQSGTYDLWHCLFRHVVQLCGHGTGRYLGGISRGADSGADSKENGVPVIVWNAIILHCRWGGFVKDRGLVVLALVGNIVTACPGLA